MYVTLRFTTGCYVCHSGSGVLVLTTTEVDKTGASYYGEQGLHYLSAKGEGNIVLLGTKTVCVQVQFGSYITDMSEC